MSNFKKNNEIDLSSWRNLIKVTSFVSPFQTPDYYTIINQIKGFNAEVIAYENKGSIKALAVFSIYKEKGIKSFFSRRAIIYGGPVLNNISDEEFIEFLNEIKEYFKRKVIYIEIRNFFNYHPWNHIYNTQKWGYQPYANFQLNLENTDKDSLLKRFKYNRRREITLSIKNQADYFQTNSVSDIKEIYSILVNLYKEKVKLPLPSFEFFEKQITGGLMIAFAVIHNKKIIGGSFCPFLKNKSIYTFYYCGIRNYHNKIFPTHLAVLAAMEYAVDNQIPIFDFMGAGLKNEKYGVRDYKKAYGGTLVEYGRYIKILNPFMYKLGLFGLKLLKKYF